MTNSALYVASHAGLREDLVASHLLQIKTNKSVVHVTSGRLWTSTAHSCGIT